MRPVDLSHVIEHAMVTYPGLPGPVIEEYHSFDDSVGHYSPGTKFTIGRISMVANTGTYLETPAHRYRDGHELAGLPLECRAQLPAEVVDACPGPIGEDVFVARRPEGAGVAARTGWDRHWGADAYGDPAQPHLTEAAARALVEAGALLVGIDSVNVDDTAGGHKPAHSVLLAAGVPVVEHLTNLQQLPMSGATVTAAPPAVRGLATFPLRCFAGVP